MTNSADHANFQNIFELYDFIEQNPKMTTEIMDLAFPRIFTLEGRDLCQVIAKAAGFNPRITEEYIKRYYLEFPKCWPKYDMPPFCECFISNNFETALKTLEDIPSNSRDDIQFKIQFYRCILQKCDTEIKSIHPLIQKIAEHLTNEAQSLPYVSIQFKDTEKECITNLLEKSLQLIEQIEDRIHIEDFDYVQLNHTLDTYPHLKKYAKQLIDKCQQKKHYSSLLWLLDLGNAEKNVYNKEIPQKPHDILYKKCILEILNNGIKLYESLPNQKSTTINRKEKDLKSKLENENEFWDLISELIVLLRISDSRNGSQTLIKDRQLGQKKMRRPSLISKSSYRKEKFYWKLLPPRCKRMCCFKMPVILQIIMHL